MKCQRSLLIACLSLLPLVAAARVTENFDAGWRFLKADAPGAEKSDFNDSTWRKLDLPHDWSIEGPFAETNKTGGAGGFLPSGIGWYRKQFTLPASASNQVVRVEFDGVMQNSDVWINGHHLGQRPNGYVSFSYELTGKLNFGGDNVLAVRCDTSAQPASRWYSGTGIYRHVRLVTTEPVHIVENGVFVSTPEIKPAGTMVQVETIVTNQSDTEQKVTAYNFVFAPGDKYPNEEVLNVWNGPAPSQTIKPGASTKLTAVVYVGKPKLWNLDTPNLYRLVTRINVDPVKNGVGNTRIVDENAISFGIRDAQFQADTGFWLNGKNFKLYGVCLHHDGGAFGAAVPLTIWEARLKALKTLGVNAIRTAHNPVAPEFLDLCDRLGFLVLDEFFDCWQVAKNPYDYHRYFNEWAHRDERDTILRDRNHPSVILYSVGNEIHDTPKAERAKAILRGLVEVAHQADPTRPVTQGLFRPNVSGDYTNGLADLLDVVGQNYREQEILAAHEQKPTRKIVGTENTHDRNQWVALRDHAPYAGQFLWTGIDYLGESRRWPAVGFASGLLDRTGRVKPMARERESWWSSQPMVRMVRRLAKTDLMPTDPGYGGEERHTQVQYCDWTPRNLSPHSENVEVYSNCREVELFLNGQSLGKKEIHANASPRNWPVAFAPGTLKAVARDEKGEVVATDELRTAGPPAKIVLATETKTLAPTFDEVAIIRARITDADGIEIPRANDLITFSVSGPGVIAAVDNGDNASHERFQTHSRHAFLGQAVAFVKATGPSGEIRVTASASGLRDDAISFKAAPSPSTQ